MSPIRSSRSLDGQPRAYGSHDDVGSVTSWIVGTLFTSSGDLRRLIGRPTTPLADAVADALR